VDPGGAGWGGGYSQSWVSKVLRGKHALTLEQARNLAARAGIPVHLLRLGDGGREDPAKRRDFTKTAALALMPWPVLSSPDLDTGPAVRAVTAAHRRLDAAMPAPDLAGGVVAHVEMARRMAAQDRGPGMAAALSEAAGFAGWLHADMCDRGSARRFYRPPARKPSHPGTPPGSMRRSGWPPRHWQPGNGTARSG
jgi:hypothetical protein